MAGIVSELGDGAKRFEVGDRVMAGTRFGGYSERVRAKVDDVVRLPELCRYRGASARDRR